MYMHPQIVNGTFTGKYLIPWPKKLKECGGHLNIRLNEKPTLKQTSKKINTNMVGTIHIFLLTYNSERHRIVC